MSIETEHDLHNQTRKALDTSLEELSPETLKRLTTIRQQALEKTAQPTFFQRLVAPMPIATALSCSFALALSLFLLLPEQTENNLYLAEQTDSTTTPFDDLVLLGELDDESFELLDDLEFLIWLDGLEESTLEEQASAATENTHFPINRSRHV